MPLVFLFIKLVNFPWDPLQMRTLRVTFLVLSVRKHLLSNSLFLHLLLRNIPVFISNTYLLACDRYLKCRGRSSHLLKHHQGSEVQAAASERKGSSPFTCLYSQFRSGESVWLVPPLVVIYSAPIVFCIMDELQLYKLLLEHISKNLILFCNISLPHSCWIFSPWSSAVWFIILL